MQIVATIEEGGQTVAVRRHEEHGRERYDVILGNVVLLSSAALETERAFGALAASAPQPPASAGAGTVIIGGLGFGVTLRGALDAVGPDARVIVVEKLAAIEALVRGPLAAVVAREAPGALDDPRVTIVRGDVSDVIAKERDVAAILLDVDNGPGWASFRTNARLYAPAGLAAARDALAPGGIFAVWSGYPADAFVAKLRAAGFKPKTVPLLERGVLAARAYVGERV